MKKLVKILFSTLLYLIPLISQSQNQYTIQHFTSENGLPQNSIKSIAADQEGFMWLATEDGLARFDGSKFSVFNSGNLNLVESRVATITPSMIEYTPGKDDVNNKNVLINYAIFSMNQSARIADNIAVPDKGYLDSLDKKLIALGKDPKNIFFQSRLPDYLYSHKRSEIYGFTGGKGGGNFFLCDSNQVTYYYKWKKQYQKASIANDFWNHFSLEDRLYYLDEQHYFTVLFNNKVERFRMAGEILDNPEYINNKKNVKVFWNKSSDQAFLILKNNLYLLSQQADGRLRTKLLVSGFDFTAKQIKSIHYAQTSNTIYLGSDISGLYILNLHQFQTIGIPANDTLNVVYSQLPYSDNAVLTADGIIIGKDLRTNQMIDKRNPTLNQINPFDKRGIIRDRNGKIWVKAEEYLYRLDEKGLITLDKWTFKTRLKTLYQGVDGHIWVGTKGGNLYAINPDNPEVTPLPFSNDILKNPTYLASLNKDTLLVGCMAGLYLMDLKSKRATLLNGTEDFYIKSLYIDANNHIWIAAQDKGLVLLTPENKLISFPLDRRRYLASPHCIVNDSLGYFWIPTNKGLFQIKIEDLLQYARSQINQPGHKIGSSSQKLGESGLYYRYHAMDEGYSTNEFNGSCQPCGLKLANGHISLPSMNGFVWFNPELINNTKPDFNIILDKAEVNQKVVSHTGDTIHLPLNPENIQLSFSAAFFGNDYNLNLSYTLVDQDDQSKPQNWVPLLDAGNITVQYSSLSSGNYTLILRKLTGFNEYSIKKYYLIVPPHWYERGWVRALLILLLVLLIYLYNAQRLSLITKKNTKLEGIVVKRTESLHQTLEELKESKNQMSRQLHLFSRLLASITHDVQSPLRFVTLTSEHIAKLNAAGETDKIDQLASIITDSTIRMSTMLKDLSDYIKVQVFRNNLRFETIDLKSLIDMKLDIFKNAIELNGSTFSNNIHKSVLVQSDYQLLSIVVHNLIDNAAKYTHHGKIEISTRIHEQKTIELVFSNTGSGLSSDAMDQINAQPDQEIEDTKSKSTNGLGLIIIKEVCKLLNINVKVIQTQQTSFHLLFE